MPVPAWTTSWPPDSNTSAVASAISSCPDLASPPPGRAATTRSSASATRTRRRYRLGVTPRGLFGPGTAAHALDVAPLALGLDSTPAGGGGGGGGPALTVDPQGVGQAGAQAVEGELPVAELRALVGGDHAHLAAEA